MIFFENNSAKIFVLVLMVGLSAVFIFSKYMTLSPLPKLSDNGGLVSQISEGTKDNFQEIKNSVELGWEQAKEVGQEIKDENDRRTLLEEVKKYTENKTTTSTASSSENLDQ